MTPSFSPESGRPGREQGRRRIARTVIDLRSPSGLLSQAQRGRRCSQLAMGWNSAKNSLYTLLEL